MTDNSNAPQGADGADSTLGETAQHVDTLEKRSQTAARLFDVRRIIGGLFVLYGVIVTIAGLFTSDADLKKAQDININLWTGIAMLILGLAFLLWLRLSPTIPPPPLEEAEASGEQRESD
ncbi:hypothetical protein [Streptomyces iconiensis]|uniref:Uncharacterized protein n=1 Tax=Streptomyces iconiensis TaxID=1384038 RepID=A0ABT7A5K0_9ACTN|nr:hypothetical protein [Streptomyces iconiensis]MDJ1136581.1 hypothetical protein [Streptomyces iconiensis]